MAEENVGSIVYTVRADTAQLVKGEQAASKSMDRLEAGMAKADKGADKLSQSIKKANRDMHDGGSAASSFASGLRQLVTAAAALATLKKLVDVQREFDRLNAGLVTATGGAERAAMAFAALQEFAAKTPYDLAQTTDAFTKLVNFGLDPSERALTSYGNTASALGKDLSQMVEAVADATTGEFERLKEFGIKASKEGDRVSVTFRGVTTNIGNNAAEIEQYLIALGENEFAGNMAARAATLDGAISNLGDTWDGLFRTVSQAGVGDLIRDAVIIATEALDELTAEIASGALQAELVALAGKFAGWGEDVQQTARILAETFGQEMDTVAGAGDTAVGFLIDAFRNLPENVRAFIQTMVVEVLAGFDKAQAYAVAFKDSVAAVFSDETLAGVSAALEAELARINETRADSIGSIMDERDAALDSYAQQRAAARKLREEYDKGQASGGGGDRLAQFRIPGTGGAAAAASGGSSETSKAAKKAAEEERKGLEANTQAIAKLREELLQASLAGEALAKRQAEIALNKYATPEQIAQVQQMAAELYKLEQAKAAPKAAEEQRQAVGQVDPLAAEQFRFEDEIAKLRALNEAKLIEDQRYLDLKTQAEYAHAEQMRVLQEENFARQSTGNALLIGTLNELQSAATSAFTGILTGATNGEEAVRALANGILNQAVGALVEMGAQYVKNLIIGQTAAAAATATGVATAGALASAYATPAALASLASFGANAAPASAGIASTVALAQSLGAIPGRRYGGPAAADGMYRVNENGRPEVFQGANGQQFLLPNQRGEVVSNENATSGGGNGVNVVVNINQSAEKAGTVARTNDGETEMIDVFVADIMGDGRTARAISTKFGLKPAGR